MEHQQKLLEGVIEVWRGEQMKYNPQFMPEETLQKLKDLCEIYMIDDKNILKEVFDECENPFVYDINTDEISNSEEEEEEEEEEPELPPAQ
tara:strand:+ start:3356 stop:3628 length:273 start_codon:yes stop_codon:yes gene_type:complete